MGFKTTTHDQCIYCKIMDDEVVHLLRQVDDCLCSCIHEKTARDIFITIGTKMRFASEEKKTIIPFEFLGVVKDYNGVDIK